MQLDLSCDDACEIAFAAFYADCVHEVLPVTQGCRLTLIYNLCRTDKKMPLPKPSDYRLEQDSVAGLLREWTAALGTDTNEALPEKLIYLLDHAYTSADLGFDALKGADSAVADVLLVAADHAACDIHLALVSVEEIGNADYAGSGRYWDEDDFEEGEVYDRTETVSEWRRPDGAPSNLPVLPFNEDEFCPPDAFSKIEPDEVQFSEVTGNAGASFERTYHSAALVIWPRSRYLAIVNQAGLGATLPVLRDLCQRWESEEQVKNSSLWHDADTLAGYMLRDWIPLQLGLRSLNTLSTPLIDFLDCICRIQDSEQLGKFWSMLAEKGFYNKEHSTSLVRTATLLPWRDVVGWTEQAISISAAQAQEACAAFLACLSAAKPDMAHDLRVAAHTLFMSLPGDQSRFPLLDRWEHARMHASVQLVMDVLISFSAIDIRLAEDALNYLLAWPICYTMDTILLPAALQLIETATSRDLVVVERLRDAVYMHLHARVAETLEAPADWRRDSRINCACQDCAQLRAFLDNPLQANWSFKAVQGRRTHLENSLVRDRCDVDFVTERRGSPHVLVCTKNQASHLRRVKQRKNDLDDLTRLAVGKMDLL